jgi:outer membrane protein assembly factor BamB|tara:strand:- start:630 stop:1922 length:1293 start_codon:yes stop_codon:yes gene_type:complete
VTKFIILLSFVFLIGCSFNSKSGFWTEEKEIEKLAKNITKILEKKSVTKKELNPNLKINIVKNFNFKPDDLTNNLAIKNFDKKINKISKFKFSRIENFEYFEPELVFDGKNFVFFDDQGNLIKFDENFKIVWKKNFYSKQEKKQKPILTLSIDKKNLAVFDNISKFYVIDLATGNLIWSKINKNPFNSQIKILDDKIYSVDMNNILRCISLIDGTEIWKFRSENIFLKSLKRNSIIIKDNKVYLNNSIGDIVAINAENGALIWQTPTQSSIIFENAFDLILSDLVAEGEDLIFSNNRNEFYSLNLGSGLINWKQEINSSVRPIFYKDLIFSVSNEGYFFVIDRKSGNIVRITDIFNVFKTNERTKIKPIGFIASHDKVILSTSNGRLLTIDISTGKTDSILKIDNEKISRPFVFNKKIILVKNNSIIRLN